MKYLSSGCHFLSGFDFFDEGGRINDLDAALVFDVSLLGIARDNVLRTCFHGAGYKHIVVGIVADVPDLIQAF